MLKFHSPQNQSPNSNSSLRQGVVLFLFILFLFQEAQLMGMGASSMHDSGVETKCQDFGLSQYTQLN